MDSIAIQSSIGATLRDAYTRFFQKQNSAPPILNLRKNNVQFLHHQNKQMKNIAVVRKQIKLPKLGLIRFAKSREVKSGRILNATGRPNPSGRFLCHY